MRLMLAMVYRKAATIFQAKLMLGINCNYIPVSLFSPIVSICFKFRYLYSIIAEETIPAGHCEIKLQITQTTLANILKFSTSLANFCDFGSKIFSWLPFENCIGPCTNATFSSETITKHPYVRVWP